MTITGTRLREIRKSGGLSLNDIATRTGLSLGYLSKVERNLTVPTIINLHKICQVLNVTMNDIFYSKNQDVFFQRSQREVMYETSEIRYESATVTNSTLKSSVLTIHKGANISSYRHAFDEIVLILSGTLEIILNDVCYRLCEGDTLFIENGSDHKMINSSEEDCVSFWVKAFCARTEKSANMEGGF